MCRPLGSRDLLSPAEEKASVLRAAHRGSATSTLERPDLPREGRPEWLRPRAASPAPWLLASWITCHAIQATRSSPVPEVSPSRARLRPSPLTSPSVPTTAVPPRPGPGRAAVSSEAARPLPGSWSVRERILEVVDRAGRGSTCMRYRKPAARRPPRLSFPHPLGHSGCTWFRRGARRFRPLLPCH